MSLDGHVPDPVDIACTHSPDEPVVIIDEGPALDGENLERRVARRAGHLREHGVEDGTRVAILVRDRLSAIIDLLAVIRAGGVAARLDPTAPDEAVTGRIDAGEITHAIVADDDGRNLDGIHFISPGKGDTIDPLPLPAGRPITLSFTSGTLGEPTPVVHSAWNHAAAAIASADRLGVYEPDRWYDPLALYHMGGLAPVTRCLFGGLLLVLSQPVAPDDLLARLAATDSTIVSVVPTMLDGLVDQPRSIPSSLRCVLVGGAALSTERFDRAVDGGLPVHASYGLTETLGQVCSASPAERSNRPMTVGRPLAGVQVTIADDGGEPVPAGTLGNIYLEGPSIAAGNPTAAAWRASYDTRDLGYRDEDGFLWVEGRADDAIITGGVVVHPATVVHTLEAHPAVAAVGVVGLPDDRWGERVAAGVVLDDPEVPIDALEAYCRTHLDRSAVPRVIRIFDALPRTPSDTVDRDALRARFEA